MTQSGEELTLKGEYNVGLESVFLFNKALAFSYGINTAGNGEVEIRTSCPDHKILESFQMVFVLKGHISLDNQAGNRRRLTIGPQQHNLCRVTLQSSRLVMSNIDDEVICINLSADFIKRYVPLTHPAFGMLLAYGDEQETPVALTERGMPVTPEIAAVLQYLGSARQNNFPNQLLLESKVIELLALQLTQFEQLQTQPVFPQLKAGELERMHKAKEILINHTGEQLSLRSLAHLVGTNEFNLKRDFKTVFGNTVYGYLNQYKMERAKSMLLTKDVNIAEIAKETGYKHATHFTTAFKRYFGYLPNKIKAGKLSLLIFLEDFCIWLDQLCCLTG